MRELNGVRLPFGTTDNVGPLKGTCPGWNGDKRQEGMTHDTGICWEFEEDAGEIETKVTQCPFLHGWKMLVGELCVIQCKFSA